MSAAIEEAHGACDRSIPAVRTAVGRIAFQLHVDQGDRRKRRTVLKASGVRGLSKPTTQGRVSC